MVAPSTPTLLNNAKQQKNWEWMLKRRQLRAFLDRHGFLDENRPRKVGDGRGARIQMECIYPIHVAAQLGDTYIVRMLLEIGVDPQTGAVGGRTPMEFAKEARVQEMSKLFPNWWGKNRFLFMTEGSSSKFHV